MIYYDLRIFYALKKSGNQEKSKKLSSVYEGDWQTICSPWNSFLTLYMLNCFKDYKRYIHILNYILDLVGPK